MYTLAKGYFPSNKKLDLKIAKLRETIRQGELEQQQNETTLRTSKKDMNVVYNDGVTYRTSCIAPRSSQSNAQPPKKDSKVKGGCVYAQLSTKKFTLDTGARTLKAEQDDISYETEVHDEDNDYESDGGFQYKVKARRKEQRRKSIDVHMQTPRTKRLLEIVNTRNVSQIRLLRGVGVKKADAIVEALCSTYEESSNEVVVKSLGDLIRLTGIGPRTLNSELAPLS